MVVQASRQFLSAGVFEVFVEWGDDK